MFGGEELEVTYTKQVHKKNKVFSDGTLFIGASEITLFDAFHKCVAHANLKANKIKALLFEQQYARALAESQGLLQGILDNVIVCLDFPALLTEPAEPETKKKRVERLPESTSFLPANAYSPPERSVLREFSPVTSVFDQLSLYYESSVVPSDESCPVDRYILRIINTVYKEVFGVVVHQTRKNALPGAWRIETKPDGKTYLTLPRGSKSPRDFFEIFIITLESEQIVVAPVWKGFDPLGRIEVKPVSKEATGKLQAGTRHTSSNVFGVIDMHCPVPLLSALRDMLNPAGTTRKGHRWSLTTTDCLKAMFLEKSCIEPLFGDGAATDVISLIAPTAAEFSLSDEQTEILNSVASWFHCGTAGAAIAVEGVFGCGKSKLVAACISLVFRILEKAQIPVYDGRILFLASTNVAVDNIVKRLLRYYIACTRIGVREKVDPEVVSVFDNTGKWKRSSRIVASTVATAADLDCHFPFVFIDEAAQVSEVSVLLPLIKTRCVRVFACGDPKQLNQTGTEKLSRSVLDAIKSVHPTQHIWTQYRCHPSIARLCSELFYGGQVISATEFISEPFAPSRVVILSHSHAASRGSLKSLRNLGEAELILKWMSSNMPFLQGKSVALMSLYNSQVDLLKQEILIRHPINTLNIVLHTVDSFQGSEADVVVLSVTASDALRSKEFIANPNRVNVALSRAKGNLVIAAHWCVWGQVEVYSKIKELGSCCLFE